MLTGSNSTSPPHDGGSVAIVNQLITYPTQALPSIKDVARLKHNGTNFCLWERQLKAFIRQVTGLSIDYLNEPLSTSTDPKVDHAIFSMLLWSLDERLQVNVEMKLSAGEVFRYFRQRFATLISVPTPLDTGANPSSDLQNGTLRHLRPTWVDSSGNKRYLEYDLWVQRLQDKERALLRPSHLEFINLPLEVMNQILDYVEEIASHEINDINTKKEALVQKPTHWHYPQSGFYPKHLPPLLNSFQSLASVNKQMYNLCRPRLWKSLHFPTEVPVPINNWIDDYLLKNGDFVKSITLHLNEEWYSDNENEIVEAVAYDNLYRYTHPDTINSYASRTQALSHESVVRILTMCPNVHQLWVSVPDSTPNPSQQGLNRFYNRMKKILSRLSSLKEIDLDAIGCEIEEKFVIDIIRNIPALTSLSLRAVGRTGPLRPTKPLVWYLTRLEHLRSLTICMSDIVDGTWRLHTWPRLTTLHLMWCDPLSFLDTHGLVQQFSSHLTNLSLDISTRVLNEPTRSAHGLSARWVLKNRFDLPELSDLHLTNPTIFNLLTTFENCKKLKYVEYQDIIASEWTSVQEMICKPSWPQLRSLKFNDQSCDSKPCEADWDMWSANLKIRKYCDQSGIEYDYSFE